MQNQPQVATASSCRKPSCRRIPSVHPLRVSNEDRRNSLRIPPGNLLVVFMSLFQTDCVHDVSRYKFQSFEALIYSISRFLLSPFPLAILIHFHCWPVVLTHILLMYSSLIVNTDHPSKELARPGQCVVISGLYISYSRMRRQPIFDRLLQGTFRNST